MSMFDERSLKAVAEHAEFESGEAAWRARMPQIAKLDALHKFAIAYAERTVRVCSHCYRRGTDAFTKDERGHTICQHRRTCAERARKQRNRTR